MNKFSHTDEEGKARMVDVSPKPDQLRTAIAGGMIYLQGQTLQAIRENTVKKGDVLTVAKIAGVQGAKQTSGLIPLCHSLPTTYIDVELTLQKNGVAAQSEVKCIGKTGAEMEALSAVTIALLTVYDMCKSIDKHMEIGEIKLIDKKKT